MEAVILTVHNRQPLVISNTLASIAKNDLTDTEVFFFDDRSSREWASYYRTLKAAFPEGKLHYVKMTAKAEYTLADDHQNPAALNNRAVEWVAKEGADWIWWVSSDMILAPQALSTGRMYREGAVWVPRTIDLDTAYTFCGHSRPFPMMWLVASSVADHNAIGGFDEEYCKGMAFEDTDYMGRLLNYKRKCIIDESVTCWHQSHDAKYMSDEGVGYKRSKDYTISKWGGGIPFEMKTDPLKNKMMRVGNHVILKPQETLNFEVVVH